MILSELALKSTARFWLPAWNYSFFYLPPGWKKLMHEEETVPE